jgi:hypothetical protein
MDPLSIGVGVVKYTPADAPAENGHQTGNKPGPQRAYVVLRPLGRFPMFRTINADGTLHLPPLALRREFHGPPITEELSHA